MPVEPTARAAHRPSRQDAVLDAAVHLYAVRPIDQVTVADIATEARMTPAAVYYHYRSKDEVLIAALRRYSGALVEQLRVEFSRDSDAPIGETVVALLHWTAQRRDASLLYFVRSPGWSPSVETLRRTVRGELVAVMTVELARRHGMTAPAAQGAAATALSSLLEVAAASWLTEDAMLANLGRRRFADEVHALAADICAG